MDSTPDGRVVLTTFDVLGRKVRVTDNVQDQAFTDSPTSRQLSAFDYDLAGTTVTATDQHGRTIHTTLDVLGRQISQIGATGITHTTTYDDAAHTTTKAVLPDGATDPQALRTATYDNANRAVNVERDYNDDTADPTQTTAFDGLGRIVSHTSDDLELEYSYLGAGGASTTQTATPHNPAYPGEPLDVNRTIALGGQQLSSQRDQAGTTADGTRLTYDPAGRIATSTDPNGRTTSYTYYDDGNVATRTTPSGTVVTDTYDDTTGRLLNVTAQPPTGPSVTLTYTYVPAGQRGAGLVHTISDGTDTVTLGYDADSHVVSRTYSDGNGDGGLVHRHRVADVHDRRDRCHHVLRVRHPRADDVGHPDPRRHHGAERRSDTPTTRCPGSTPPPAATASPPPTPGPHATNWPPKPPPHRPGR